MKKPAVFIDRDGTINEQMGYINHLTRFKILPGVAEAIRLLNENNVLAIVVSNQSGVGRGYFPVELVEEIHDYMKKTLEKEGAFFDGIFFCPHYPGASIPEYNMKCSCRKPGTGLIEQAGNSFDIDMSRSYAVGDRITDMEMAARANLKGIIVKTGYGRGDLEHVFPKRSVKPAYVAEDLLDGVRWIVSRIGR